MQAPPSPANPPDIVMAAYHQRGVFPSTIEQTESVTQSGPRLLRTCGGRAMALRSGAVLSLTVGADILLGVFGTAVSGADHVGARH